MLRQSLNLKKVPNARQLGGYTAANGLRVKKDVLLRTGLLAGATEEDLAALKALGLTTIVDFRTEEEALQHPDPKIEGVTNYMVPVLEENSEGLMAIVEVYRQHADEVGKAFVEMVRSGGLTERMYTGFFDSKVSMALFRKFFDILLAHEQGAVLWHCTGGKDRTGVATVMLLGVLGVDDETILADFSLTNAMNQRRIDYIKNEAAKYTSDPSEIEQAGVLAGVSVPFMQKVIDIANAESGSLKAFVQNKVSLTDEEVEVLRKKFLE